MSSRTKGKYSVKFKDLIDEPLNINELKAVNNFSQSNFYYKQSISTQDFTLIFL